MADILEWKLSWLGITLSPVALLAWVLARMGRKGRLRRRFLDLLRKHGLETVQLLQLLPPEIKPTASDLLEDSKTLGILNDDMLSWLTKTFGVRRSWLEGHGKQIYEPLRAYKALDSFFRELEQMGVLDRDLQPFILHEKGCKLTAPLGGWQVPVLVLAHRFTSLDGKPVRRFIICGDSWTWRHPPARFHLKAIARVFFKAFTTSTILVPVERRKLDAVRNGMVIPQWLPEGSGGHEMFEEYALSAEESQIAQETEELPMVLELIEKSDFLRGLLEQR
jgi:hypothetical protein